ncbi:hypothetical protein [Campylobacter canadensis]|uniref:Uncharacterized protein n=1 Tax=Campylobacter canadensis TaxID=449520 RepID=A0ABS7WT77_9BACT|nr:hypothetical protein [Campylobacter canadensis]MBZ7987985.1 hypothetical protein [Campylobacter canadensis]MBZ7998945.1 hypothetical protein [Campylobacter canadensis]
MNFFYKFITNLRNAFSTTNNSLNFRAKLFACMILVLKEPKNEIYLILKQLCKEIYSKKIRQEMLYYTTLQYINMNKNDPLAVDKLLKDLSKNYLKVPKYRAKLNFVRLEKMVLKKNIKENESEIEDYGQIRVIEFIKKEII